MTDKSGAQHPLHWLPNALTVGRILLIPVLVACLLSFDTFSPSIDPVAAKVLRGEIFSQHAAPIALIIFLICMLSDFLDGYFARKWKVTSTFGRMLDPIADKLLVAACLISILIIYFGMSIVLIPALMIIGRDIAVSGIREFAAQENRIMPPTKLAKWKTAAEMIAILLFILCFVYSRPHHDFEGGWVMYPPLSSPMGPAEWLSQGFIALLWIAAILSVYTGALYFRAALVKTDVIDGSLDPNT